MIESGGGRFAASELWPGRVIAAISLERLDRPLSCEYTESLKSTEIEHLCRLPVSASLAVLLVFFDEAFEFTAHSISSAKLVSSVMLSDFILPLTESVRILTESVLGRPAALLIEKLE